MIMLELRMGILERELFLFLKGGWLRFEGNGREKLKISSFCLVLLHAPNDVFFFNPVFSIFKLYFQFFLFIYIIFQILKRITTGITEDRCHIVTFSVTTWRLCSWCNTFLVSLSLILVSALWFLCSSKELHVSHLHSISRLTPTYYIQSYKHIYM